MGGPNILQNGALNGPIRQATSADATPLASTNAGPTDTIPGWTPNNAQVEIVSWPLGPYARNGVVKVGDAGGCSEITQTVDTVIGQTYTISYDVWTDDSETNSGNQLFCSSTDTNGIMVIRPGVFDGTCASREANEAGG